MTIALDQSFRGKGVAAFARGLTRLGLALPVYVVFVCLIGLPLATVLLQAVLPHLFDTAGWSLALDAGPLLRAFTAPRSATAIVNSVELSALVAVTATVVGGGFAVLQVRYRFPLQRSLAVLPWLVFLTPSYLKALAWVLLMSPGGYLPQLGLFPAAWSPGFFSVGGLVFVHTISLFPVPAFIIASALAGIGVEYEDAARIAGTPAWKIWLRIYLPLLLPALALSLMAVFAEALSDFGLASTIARLSGFGVLTYGIYVAASDYPVDFPMAGGQALVLLTLVLLVVVADRTLRRRAPPRLISGRSRPAPRRVLGPRGWLVTGGLALFALLALLLPLAAIVMRASTKTLSDGLDLANFTAANLAQALSLGSKAGEAIGRSLGFATLTAVVATAISVVLAAQLDRASQAVKASVVGLSLGAVAIPGIVLGFGYILTWNRIPFFRDWDLPQYGSASLLVMGYVAAALPYCLIVIVSAIEQLAPSLTDAARIHGIPLVRRFTAIVLPLVLASVVTAFLLTFVRTMFELPMSQMLVPRDGPAAPTVILNLFSHDHDATAAAMALIAMLVTGAVGGTGWTLFRFAMAQARRRATA